MNLKMLLVHCLFDGDFASHVVMHVMVSVCQLRGKCLCTHRMVHITGANTKSRVL